jgi:hypothetical protein
MAKDTSTSGQTSPTAMEASDRRPAANGAQRQHALLDKIAIFCGPTAQLLFFLFLPASLNLPPIAPHRTPEDTAQHYVDNHTGMKGGISIMLMTGAIWPIFCAGINRQLSKIPGVSQTALFGQLAAGSLGAVSMMLPAMFFSAVIYRLERDPVITQTMSDLAWFVYAMGFPPFIGQDLMISCAILSDKRPEPLIPHWVAWVMSAFTLTLYPALGVHCVKSGAVAWNGALGFWLGAVGFGGQVGLLVMYLLKAHAKPDPEP